MREIDKTAVQIAKENNLDGIYDVQDFLTLIVSNLSDMNDGNYQTKAEALKRVIIDFKIADKLQVIEENENK